MEYYRSQRAGIRFPRINACDMVWTTKSKTIVNKGHLKVTHVFVIDRGCFTSWKQELHYNRAQH